MSREDEIWRAEDVAVTAGRAFIADPGQFGSDHGGRETVLRASIKALESAKATPVVNGPADRVKEIQAVKRKAVEVVRALTDELGRVSENPAADDLEYVALSKALRAHLRTIDELESGLPTTRELESEMWGMGWGGLGYDRQMQFAGAYWLRWAAERTDTPEAFREWADELEGRNGPPKAGEQA